MYVFGTDSFSRRLVKNKLVWAGISIDAETTHHQLLHSITVMQYR